MSSRLFVLAVATVAALLLRAAFPQSEPAQRAALTPCEVR